MKLLEQHFTSPIRKNTACMWAQCSYKDITGSITQPSELVQVHSAQTLHLLNNLESCSIRNQLINAACIWCLLHWAANSKNTNCNVFESIIVSTPTQVSFYWVLLTHGSQIWVWFYVKVLWSRCKASVIFKHFVTNHNPLLLELLHLLVSSYSFLPVWLVTWIEWI